MEEKENKIEKEESNRKAKIFVWEKAPYKGNYMEEKQKSTIGKKKSSRLRKKII